MGFSITCIWILLLYFGEFSDFLAILLRRRIDGVRGGNDVKIKD